MNKSRGNSLFSLLLLLIFAFCSFFILLVQIKGYQDLTKENEKVSEIHTPIAYLSNKLRSFDQIEDVKFIEVDGNHYLKLESDSMDLWIYEYQGKLCELYNAKNREFNPKEGEKLFSIDAFNVKEEENKLIFNITINKQKEEFILHLRSGR